MKIILSGFILLLFITGCNGSRREVPVIGFADAFEDNTLSQAKQGFFEALKKNGFSEDQKTIEVLYRNAQGDIPKLTLAIKYFISQKVTLIAANSSLSTITAIQNTKDIPVFMMVAPEPSLMHVIDARGNGPANLFGVGESLAYIDTSFSLVPKLVTPKNGRLKIGMLYNQSEPQSGLAVKRIEQLAASFNVGLESLPVNNSADVKLVTASLLSKHIDAFFAIPDNTIFSSFETIIQSCNDAGVPVFTSESGLVARGAVAAYGADIYQWGYQAGVQAAKFLRDKSTNDLHWEMVQWRKRVFNPEAAKRFNIAIPANFEAVK
jgi:putative tryptophan/tyrosine transport system substrate-binding protein